MSPVAEQPPSGPRATVVPRPAPAVPAGEPRRAPPPPPAQPVAADCADAASWLVAHLQAQPLGEGLSREVSAEPGALVRVRISAPEVGERRRWLSPAAYGLCGPMEQIDATL